ncbi:GntR family transcriptional regulator [Microbacterium sp. BWT-B31]|uniref:GntR family transcriptional regulator n=1 Tax=Microbacterium sp. BWT-B31 TaxID=3232072 RepID=UPI003529C0B6
MAKSALYHRIQGDISASIASGEYAPGERIPSESALADRYGVTRMTVRQAISGLITKGLVTRKQGSGTYVLRTRQPARALNQLTGFTEDMTEQGYRPTSRQLSNTEEEAPEHVQEWLELNNGAHVIRLERVRFLDETPTALHLVWLPLWLAPDLVRRSMDNVSLYQTLEDEFGIRLSTASQRISAVRASAHEAEVLKVEVGSPLLYTEKITRDENNQPVEFVQSWATPELPIWVELQR